MNVYFCDKRRHSSFNLFPDEKWLSRLTCVCILISIKWTKMHASRRLVRISQQSRKTGRKLTSMQTLQHVLLLTATMIRDR